MLNFRQVSKKFYLSGGWTDIEKDPNFLVAHNIHAVVDLQWTPDDSHTAADTVRDALSDLDIDYTDFVLYDNEYNNDAQNVFEAAASLIHELNEKWDAKRDRILIKCGAGLSRSVTAYIWYLCVYERLSFPEAYDKFLIEHREQNPYFEGTPHAINDYFWNLLKKSFPDTREIK